MKTFAFKRIAATLLSLSLCLSAVSCQNDKNETTALDTEHSECETSGIELPEMEELTSITEIITDPIPMVDSLQIDTEYQYTDLPEITGQTSNLNIFTTADAETPFLHFGEDGLVPCEVEIKEYPVSLTIGNVTVSDVYKEYSFEGEIFYPNTKSSGSLSPGGAYAKDVAFLWTFHKQDSLIYCHISYYGICDIVVYDIDSQQWSRLLGEGTPTIELYQSIAITGDSLYYLALRDSMSLDRSYMLYVVSDSVDTIEFDYYLYCFTSRTSTLVCDCGFDAEIILGGSAAAKSIWLDNNIVRIFPYSDEVGFSDHFISNDGSILTKTYTYNDYNDISLLKNGTIYFGRYRIIQNDKQGIFSVEHIDTEQTSLSSFSFKQSDFSHLFSEKFSMLHASDTSHFIALSQCGDYMLLRSDNGVMICDLQKGLCSKFDLSQYIEKILIESNMFIVYKMYLTTDGFICVLSDSVQTKLVIYFEFE